MAAPAKNNVHNMGGVWTMNKTLSDSLDPMLKIQGIPWVMRKTLGLATVEIAMVHTTEGKAPGATADSAVELTSKGDTASLDTIKAKQIIRPGKFETVEDQYILDAQPRESTVPVFGHISAQARYVQKSDIEDAELRESIKDGEGDTIIEETLKGLDKGWQTLSVWMFLTVQGERRYVRHTLATKGEERQLLKVVYDFVREA